VAWQTTLECRVWLNRYMLVMSRQQLDLAGPPLLGVLALWLAAAVWLRLYRERPDPTMTASLARLIESVIVVSTSTIVLTFFSRQLGNDKSRSFVLLFAPISFLFLVASLRLAGFITMLIEERWNRPKRVAVIGTGPGVSDMVEAIRQSRPRVLVRGLILPEALASAGIFEPVAAGWGGISAPGTLPVLGTTRQLAAVINRECLDRIIVASGSLTGAEFEHCDVVTRRMGVTVSHPIRTAGLRDGMKYKVDADLQLLDLTAVPFTRRQEVVKRAFDVVICLALLTLVMPLFGLIAALICLTSPGPVFYRSQRVGKGGRYFTFWKFRSMYIDGVSRAELAARNERSGHVFKIRRDPRVTPVGRVLRRLSLDELPQLLNVLAGDMSLIGPRPLPAEDLDPDGMSTKFRQWAEQRAMVRPGITGLWQVSGRSDLPFAKMTELDLAYIRDWSLGMDFRILLSTPRAVFSSRGAY
jgi:exopolysaccharide biosynthesis polyprenyl glycosylphosphotransferase